MTQKQRSQTKGYPLSKNRVSEWAKTNKQNKTVKSNYNGLQHTKISESVNSWWFLKVEVTVYHNRPIQYSENKQIKDKYQIFILLFL